MIEKKYTKIVEDYFGEKVVSINLINRTSLSEIYLLKTELENKYILKEGLTGKENIYKEYLNHEVVYNVWHALRETLNFYVPAVYFHDGIHNYYVMEYVENSIDLQTLIFKLDKNKIEDLLYKTGNAFCEYHEKVSTRFKDRKKAFNECRMVNPKERLTTKNHLLDLYTSMPADTYRFIFKDAKPSNVLIDNKERVWLVDFQNIYYFAPFYYDIARFIDTLRIFSFKKSPLKYLLKRKKISNLVESFIQGYGKDISLKYLDVARRIHQKEHVEMKYKRGQMLEMFILKALYKLKV